MAGSQGLEQKLQGSSKTQGFYIETVELSCTNHSSGPQNSELKELLGLLSVVFLMSLHCLITKL